MRWLNEIFNMVVESGSQSLDRRSTGLVKKNANYRIKCEKYHFDKLVSLIFIEIKPRWYGRGLIVDGVINTLRNNR